MTTDDRKSPPVLVMVSEVRIDFRKRFRRRVLFPGAVILLATAVLCGGALVVAGRGTDTMSALGQQLEVWRATTTGLDQLALAQESIGLCETCIDQARSPAPDAAWLNENIAARMFDLYDTDATYILDGQRNPVFASLRRETTDASLYNDVAAAV